MPQLIEGAPDPTPNPSDVLANSLLVGGFSGVSGFMAVYELVDRASALEEAAAGVTAAAVGYAVGKAVVAKALEFIHTRSANRRHLQLQAEVAKATARADELGLRDDF